MEVKNIGRQKPPPTDEVYQVETALADVSKTPHTEDFLHALGQSALMIIDPEVLTQLLSDARYKGLIPAFSHLNRISNIGKLEAKLLEYDYEALIITSKMEMDEDKYNARDWKFLQSLGMHARFIIHDSFNGHKAKMISEQIRVIRTELSKVKTKGRWLF